MKLERILLLVTTTASVQLKLLENADALQTKLSVLEAHLKAWPNLVLCVVQAA